MKDIIILLHEPFTRRHCEMYGVDELRSRGFNLTVWDISAYVFPNLRLVDTLTGLSYVVKLNSVAEFSKRLKQIDVDKTVFFVECVDNWRTRHIYRLMSDAQCYRVRIDFYANNIIPEPLSLRLRRLFSPVGPDVLRGKACRQLMHWYFKVYHVRPFERLFSSSAISSRTDCINHPDYETYCTQFNPEMAEPLPEGLRAEGYIVFCDNYFPLHPDFSLYQHKRHMPSAEVYQQTMSRFFDHLETTTGKPVIVAAHPKSDYQGNEFGVGRRIIKYRTGQLAVNAYAVILHASNSVSYAVLADRRTLLVTTDGFNSLMRLRVRLQCLGRLLGKTVINLDKDDYRQVELQKIDDRLRRDYIQTYLTSEATREKRNVDILTEAFA